MEDAGAQVANPVPIHQPLALRFCSTPPIAKKRDPPFHPSNFVYQNSDDWNPKSWDWDSSRFVAKPMQSDGFLVGSSKRNPTDLAGRMEIQNGSPNARKPDNTGEEDENLMLKLGTQNATGSGAVNNLVEELHAVPRPNKRVRSGSPGSAKYPMCQVDNCGEDLSASKDYHRRHKVCEVHSKSNKALVGKQIQRFCQQCSRFHLLSEFDEGKRSCRRRLAGHNRRRRKTQPEDSTPSSLIPNSSDNNANCSLDIVNLLAVLACAQGNHGDTSSRFPSIPDKDKLVQILSTINSLSLPAELASKIPRTENKNTSIPTPLSSENQSQENENVSSPSTMDFLAAIAAAPGATSSEGFEMHSGPSTEGSDSEKTKSPHVEHASNFQKVPIKKISPGGVRSRGSYRHPLEDSNCHVHDASPSLTLQLFSSSGEDDKAKKLQQRGRNYLSSESSSPSEGRSPLSSHPIVYNLFPMHASIEMAKHDHLSTNGSSNTCAKTTMSNGCSPSLCLFGGSDQARENVPIIDSPYHAGCTSSGSDRSPSSMTSDVQDRTGRMIFKLFDKDPSHLPGSLREQIFNWLSSSPSEMESYIRPGCIVLSLYLSMPYFAWEQLEENLLNYVKCLVKDIDANFWGNGRFLIHTDKQIASHLDGRIRLCKSMKAWSSPELISISPVAIVGGQKTSLLLRGRRLTSSGTKIHCTHPAGYDIKSVSALSHRDDMYDEIRLDSFKIEMAESSVLGRCFIEVENNFRGSSFPVIVADNAICRELKLLEPEINGIDKACDVPAIDPIQISGKSQSREEVLQFLNELGWLFQRKCNSSLFDSPEYKLSRFQFLLIFSVEHDFCALVQTLLDILLEYNSGVEGLVGESLKMLAESYLLTKAVKRKCRKMVDLLIHYSVIDPRDGSNKFIFVPNMVGPNGITPLHLAASTLSSDEMVDALTSDPQEIGLRCWNSALDANGLSPYAYALMRNNNSYNSLVSRKISDRKSNQVSVLIDSEPDKIQVKKVERAKRNTSDLKSCSKCALVAGCSNRIQGAQGLLQRPYIHSMLVIAAVCVCVCVFLRSHPDIGNVSPFAWENLGYGAS